MFLDIRKTPKKRPFSELEKPNEKEAQAAAPKRPRDLGPLKARFTALVGRAQPFFLLAAISAFIFSFGGGVVSRIAGAAWTALLAGFVWLSVFEAVWLSRQFVFSRLRLARFASAVLFLAASGLFLGKAMPSAGVGPTKLTFAAALAALLFLSAKNYSRRALSLAITIYFLASSLLSAFILLALRLGSGAMAARLAESGWWLVLSINFILLFAWLWPQTGRVKLFWAAALWLHLAAILWWRWAASSPAFWTFPTLAALSSLAGVYVIHPIETGEAIIVRTDRNIVIKQLSLLVFLAATMFLIWSAIG